MTISPTTAIIAIIVVVVVFALMCDNGRLTEKLKKYEADANSVIKKIDDEMKKEPSANALEKRKWRAERAMIVSPNGTKRYVPKYMCDRVPSEKQFGRQKWVLKPEYLNYCPEVASGEVEINPRTNQPYKTSKAQRESSKKWNAKHPERNSTERSKERNKERKEKYVQLWYNGRTRIARKEHCRRVIGKHGKEKWEVLPEFRNLYAWCRGDQDEKKNA